MRLGEAFAKKYDSPLMWAEALKQKGYSAAICPVDYLASDKEIEDYRKTAKQYDIVIGEVGVWNNPLHPNKDEREKAVWFAKKQLELADEIEAKCCVNISGSCNKDLWYAPHPDNFKQETFELAVETIRDIIDGVKPKKTFYTLEPSPWLYPDTIEAYLRMIEAVGRTEFAVHWDPVNMMFSPKSYYENGEFLKRCVRELGSYIKSCHLKDIYMDESFTLHIQERRAGDGILDYGTLIEELDRLNPDMPAFIEHLDTEEDYREAALYVKGFMQG